MRANKPAASVASRRSTDYGTFVPGFDIHTLLSFQPPEFQCEKCRALLESSYTSFPHPKLPNGKENYGERYCPICKLRYLPAGHDTYHLAEYLDMRDCQLKWKNPVEQGRRLASVAEGFRRPGPYAKAVPLRSLLLALGRAEQFVHLCSFSIDLVMLGVLKMAAQRVPVRGVVSGVTNPTMLSELREFKAEAPNLELKLYGAEKKWSEDMPHTKLVVIDGLLAFKGSANFSLLRGGKRCRGGS